VNRPTLKKLKIGKFGRPPPCAEIFFRNSVNETFFRTLRSTSVVKMGLLNIIFYNFFRVKMSDKEIVGENDAVNIEEEIYQVRKNHSRGEWGCVKRKIVWGKVKHSCYFSAKTSLMLISS
jgi:hypothetical protein